MRAWLNHMYERHPLAYVYGCLAVVFAMGLVVGAPVGLFIGSRFYDLSLEQYLIALLAIDAATVVAYLTTVILGRRELRLMIAWAKGRRDPGLIRELMVGVQEVVPRAVVAGSAAVVLLVCPVAVFAILVPVHQLAPGDAALIYVSALMICSYSALVGWAWADLCVRPGVAELARLAPSENRLRIRPISFSIRLMVSLLLGTMLAGAFVGAMQTDKGSGGEALLRVLLLSFGVSATFVLVLIVMSALRVLEPIRDLIRGTEAVKLGNLDEAVPVSTTDELGLLAESFNEMVVGLRERESLREDLLASRARIVATADEERRRMERDLHDGAQQHLVLLKMKLGIAADRVQDDPETAALLKEAQDDLGTALAELRDLAHGIYPALLVHDGLPGALRVAVERNPLTTTFNSDGAGRYRPELEAAVYFCCLEALQNASKHAGDEAQVTVALSEHGGELRFEVADDGRGYDVFAVGPSAGLQNMADRIGALGGTLNVESAVGEGVRVMGSVPIEGGTP